jgi:hypothetical protein
MESKSLESETVVLPSDKGGVWTVVTCLSLSSAASVSSVILIKGFHSCLDGPRVLLKPRADQLLVETSPPFLHLDRLGERLPDH